VRAGCLSKQASPSWTSVLSLERLCVSDLCLVRLTIVSDSRRVRQLRFAQPPYMDTL